MNYDMSKTIRPQYLKKGDKIAIVSPAGKIESNILDFACDTVRDYGFEPVPGKYSKGKFNQFSGTDLERLSDFQNAIDDAEIKAVLCSRGGYGSIRILSKVSWTKFMKSVKWIAGYSDITVFHSFLNKTARVQSIHGTMPKHFIDPVDEVSTQKLFDILQGKDNQIEFDGNIHDRQGTAEGEIVGGNLSILCSLRGTSSDIDTDDKILFIEDVGEYLYNIDRMMQNLLIGGKLNNLRALVVGGFSDMKDNDTPFGFSAFEIIKQSVEAFSYPVAFGFPAGHISPNYSFRSGAISRINITQFKTEFFQKG